MATYFLTAFQTEAATTAHGDHLRAAIRACSNTFSLATVSDQTTLTGFETPHIGSDLGPSTFDVPAIHTYDTFGFGAQVDFAANIPLPPIDKLKTLLQNAASGTFQLSIQSLAASTVGKRTDTKVSNGGIAKDMEEPLSFKAQYPYAKHALKTGTFGTTKAVVTYSVGGTAEVDMVIYSDGTKLVYPTAKSGLSVHSAGTGSTLSGDSLHLYRDSKNPPAPGYSSTKAYTAEDHAKLILGNDNISRAVLYTVRYGSDWKLSTTDSSKTVTPQTLAQEDLRTGLILLLSAEDFTAWSRDSLVGETLFNALKNLSLIKDHAELRQILGME